MTDSQFQIALSAAAAEAVEAAKRSKTPQPGEFEDWIDNVLVSSPPTEAQRHELIAFHADTVIARNFDATFIDRTCGHGKFKHAVSPSGKFVFCQIIGCSFKVAVENYDNA